MAKCELVAKLACLLVGALLFETGLAKGGIVPIGGALLCAYALWPSPRAH